MTAWCQFKIVRMHYADEVVIAASHLPAALLELKSMGRW